MEYQHVAISPSRCELFARASEYVARGWSVLPLRGKVSTIPWQEFQTRRPSPLELSSWFLETSQPPTGIGIVAGRVSRLVVVDCDTQADATFWNSHYPASSLIVETGGGGSHFYYASPVDVTVRNRVKVLGRCIDIRGDGGYVVAPPSLHRSGKRYAWLTTKGSERLTEFSPTWVEDSSPIISLPQTTATRNVRRVVAYIRRIEAVAGNGGHNATFRAACKLRDAGMPVDEALAVLERWNETNAMPPWSSVELRHKILSAYSQSTSQ
jgi:hypothetical protein